MRMIKSTAKLEKEYCTACFYDSEKETGTTKKLGLVSLATSNKYSYYHLMPFREKKAESILTILMVVVGGGLIDCT